MTLRLLPGPTAAEVDALVAQAVETHTPGISLGCAERITSFATTNTNTNTGGSITGLTVTVTGQGRAVDIEFFAASVYHSVASTLVGFNLSVSVNGGATSTTSNFSQAAGARSTLTNGGPSCVLRRTATLASGSTYAFTINVAGGAAGTSNVVAAAFAPMHLSVVSR